MSVRVVEANLSDSGGAFSLIYSIQRNLYDREKSEVVFDYFCMGKFEKDIVVSDIKRMGGRVYSANLRHNRLIGFFRLPILFYKYCKENKVKIVHIHSDSAYMLQIYSIPAKLAGVKTIIGHSHCAGMNGDYRKIKTIAHILLRPFISKSTNIYLSCSDLATNWMYGKGMHKDVIWLKNGVDTSKFRFDYQKRKDIRLKLNIDNNTIALTTIGDFGYQKNPFFACDIMKHLDNKFKLFFIGDGQCRKSVEKYVKNNFNNGNIIFLGKRNVSEILNAMDLFLMPSRFEGLPVSGVEAQANGLPCIFSNKITKQVSILDSSLFLDIKLSEEWAKKIKSIKPSIKNREKKADLIKEENFDIQDTADQLYDIYRSCR